MDGMAPRHRPRRGDHPPGSESHPCGRGHTAPRPRPPTARYKHLKIEVPTTQRLERLAHAVTRTVEDQFFTTLAQALSPEMCQHLDTLLTDARPRCR